MILDLIFKGTGPQRLSNLAWLHSISWTNQLILVKLNTIYHYFILQIWLDFGDLELIFKGTGLPILSNFTCLYSVSWTNQLILVKHDTIYHYYILQIWLDFGDLQKSVHYKCLTEHKRLLVHERPSFRWFVLMVEEHGFLLKTILVS